MSVENDIVKAKDNLRNALGDRFELYMQNMKNWFKGKLNKQEFDLEARNIVTDNYIHLHNEFLLCIIRKCHNFATNPQQEIHNQNEQNLSKLMQSNAKTTLQTQPTSKRQRPNNKQTNQQRFQQADFMKYVAYSQINNQTTLNLEYCSRERTLPYAKMIHGRLLVAILDMNIDNLDVNCVFLIAEATIHLLKNIISKLIESHKPSTNKNNVSFYGKHFYYHKNKRKNENNNVDESSMETDEDFVEDKNQELLDLKYISEEKPINQRINLFELKSLLINNRFLLPSHSIFTINMEKIIANLYHEENQDQNENENDCD